MKRCLPILLLIAVVLLVLLTGCDKRNSDKPSMTVTLGDTLVYNESNYNTIDIYVQLRGDQLKIQNQLVRFDYDPDAGLLVGSGSSLYIRTDANGFGHGEFVVADSLIGTVSLVAYMDTYPSVRRTLHIKVYDIPEIYSLIATPDSIATGSSTASIEVRLRSSSANAANQWVRFDTIAGDISPDSVQTNAQGKATVVYTKPSTKTNVMITATLSAFPGKTKNLILKYF